MAEKQIVKIGDPVLRKVCRPIDQVSPHVVKLLDDLVETLYARPGRAGLAAPQIGIAKRVVVMDCGDGLLELINPQIVEKSGEQYGEEACLSIPGVYGYVKRANELVVKTLTRAGEEVFESGQLFNEGNNEPLDVFAVRKFFRQHV